MEIGSERFSHCIVTNRDVGDYTVARMPDMPQVFVHIVPSNDPPTGMGEPGFPPLASAYASALAKLSGKRLRRLPFPR
jgi:isoquinoline 1-oxidoreductase beta subunit